MAALVSGLVWIVRLPGEMSLRRRRRLAVVQRRLLGGDWPGGACRCAVRFRREAATATVMPAECVCPSIDEGERSLDAKAPAVSISKPDMQHQEVALSYLCFRYP